MTARLMFVASLQAIILFLMMAAIFGVLQFGCSNYYGASQCGTLYQAGLGDE
jgi:hypothetical protein